MSGVRVRRRRVVVVGLRLGVLGAAGAQAHAAATHVLLAAQLTRAAAGAAPAPAPAALTFIAALDTPFQKTASRLKNDLHPERYSLRSSFMFFYLGILLHDIVK